MIFPVGVFLREKNRLKRNIDKETLNIFKQDIFDDNIPVSRTIRKYFKTVKDINTKYNLAYKHSTCRMVSEKVRSMLLKTSEPYDSKETLVCRSWFKVKKQASNVNYEYEITAVEGEIITLSNAMTLPIGLIKNNFAHNYCTTCHSFQGNTFKEPVPSSTTSSRRPPVSGSTLPSPRRRTSSKSTSTTTARAPRMRGI